MKLRAFALLLTLALGLLAAPVPGEAQRMGRVYTVGLLTPRFSSFGSNPQGGETRLQWLAELGYLEGENVRFEHRFAAGSDERLLELAAELVRLNVDVIVTSGTPAIRAAKQATRTIPIVMLVEGDPVKAGLVASLARPGGNITGLTYLVPELSGKRLQLLTDAVPGLSRVAVLWNPANPDKAADWRATEAAARLLGVELQSLAVRSRDDFESAFKAAVRDRAGALLVLADRLTFSQAQRIADLAARSRLPAMYPHRWFVNPLSGGLMSYGPDTVAVARRLAAYVDKILKGANPGDLPVEQPTRFELVINMKTAKALGLTIPPSLLIRVDRVIK